MARMEIMRMSRDLGPDKTTLKKFEKVTTDYFNFVFEENSHKVPGVVVRPSLLYCEMLGDISSYKSYSTIRG